MCIITSANILKSLFFQENPRSNPLNCGNPQRKFRSCLGCRADTQTVYFLSVLRRALPGRRVLRFERLTSVSWGAPVAYFAAFPFFFCSCCFQRCNSSGFPVENWRGGEGGRSIILALWKACCCFCSAVCVYVCLSRLYVWYTASGSKMKRLSSAAVAGLFFLSFSFGTCPQM